MKSGKGLVEMLKFGREKPHENVIDVEQGKKIFRYDPQKEWFSETLVKYGAAFEPESSPLPEDAEVPVKGWIELHEPNKRVCLSVTAEKPKIPRLSSRKLRTHVTIPRIYPAVLLYLAKTEKGNLPADETFLIDAKAPCKTSNRSVDVIIKVFPTPKRRGPKSFQGVNGLSGPAVPKPLKVIRRRGEQEPKIFETTARPLPRAMLDGIRFDHEAEGNAPFE